MAGCQLIVKIAGKMMIKDNDHGRRGSPVPGLVTEAVTKAAGKAADRPTDLSNLDGQSLDDRYAAMLSDVRQPRPSQPRITPAPSPAGQAE